MSQVMEKMQRDAGTLSPTSQISELLDEVRFAIAQADWHRFRELSVHPGGFGVEGRKEAWPFLLHANEKGLSEFVVPKQARTHEAKPVTTLTPESDASVPKDTEADAPEDGSINPHPDERQVKLDTDRSFVMYPQGSDKEKLTRQSQLYKVIVAVLRKRRKLGYFQGYHDIISVLYLTLPDSGQVLSPLLVSCSEKISLHRLRDAMGAGLEPLVGFLRILKRLLRESNPELAQIVESSSPLPYFALSNLLTLFSHDVATLPLIQRIFDFLLCRAPIFVVYLEAAFIISRKNEITRLAEEGEEGMMHSILSQLPDMVPDGMEESERQMVQPSSSKPLPASRSPSRQPREGILGQIDETPSGGSDNMESRGRSLGASWESNISITSPDSTTAASEEGDDQDERTTLAPSEASSLPTDTDTTFIRAATPPPPPKYTEKLTMLVSPEHEVMSGTPLSQLLVAADQLYLAYPPSHPSIAVDEIMGPNSVLFTWTERNYKPPEVSGSVHSEQVAGQGIEGGQKASRCLPSDDAAEEMVTHKSLVVLPYDPEEEFMDVLGGGAEYKPMKRIPVHKRRRLRLDVAKLDKGTILTGMVLLLGVGVAIYLKTDRRSINANVALIQAEIHGHLLQAQAIHWKQWAAWAGGVLLGLGGIDDEQ
ncbi:hypothetical protein FRB98_003849 [Tulasnella sp. 332]|nr:hypothetical protein FRB98_003849 [Tulasnella sp. 332]